MIAGVVIDDDSGGEIHANIANLEERESSWKVVGVTQFRDEAEEGDVTSVSEAHVGHCFEALREIQA